jgi:hypothetical protein
MHAFVTRSFFALVILVVSAAVFAQSASPVLTVDGEHGRHSLGLDDLRGRLETHEIEVVNPDLGRPVRYLTFSLADVLSLMDAGDAEDLVFHCLDGYESNTAAANVAKLDLRLAYGEDGVPGRWSPIPTGKTMTDPAPFIVISANTSDSKTFSWPFQMTRIEAVSFRHEVPPDPAHRRPRRRRGCQGLHRISRAMPEVPLGQPAGRRSRPRAEYSEEHHRIPQHRLSASVDPRPQSIPGTRKNAAHAADAQGNRRGHRLSTVYGWPQKGRIARAGSDPVPSDETRTTITRKRAGGRADLRHCRFAFDHSAR